MENDRKRLYFAGSAAVIANFDEEREQSTLANFGKLLFLNSKCAEARKLNFASVD